MEGGIGLNGMKGRGSLGDIRKGWEMNEDLLGIE